MLPKLMGSAVFSVGFFMLILALLDLLGIGGFNYDTMQRIFIYLGGIVLCLIGYFMARRLPRVELPPEEIVQTTTEIQEGPPTEHF
jgi:cytochrome c biogenesis protein CcdA